MKPSEEFRDWVRNFVQSNKPGTQLPLTRELAAAWPLSYATIRNILADFAARGTVLRIKGTGTFVPGTSPTVRTSVGISPHRRAHSIDSVVESIQEGITTGLSKRGAALPLQKALSIQLGASSKTVGAAYRELVRRKLVSRIGRHYFVGSPSDRRRNGAQKSVFFFARSPDENGAPENGTSQSHFLQGLEFELLQCAYRLQMEPYESFEDHAALWIKRDSVAQGIILGPSVVESIPMLWLQPRQPLMRSLLISHGRPRAAIVAISSYSPFRIPGLYYLGPSHNVTTKAREIAQWVAHHQFAHITLFTERAHNLAPGTDSIADDMRLLTETLNTRPSMGFEIVMRSNTESPTKARLVTLIQRVWGEEHVVQRLSKYRPFTFEELLGRITVCSDFEPIYEQSPHHSLWIFGSPGTAISANEWCSRRKRAVPSDVSIMGYRDDESLCFGGISASSLDWAGAGYLAAHAVLGDMPMSISGRGFIRTRAMILERRSTP